MIKVGAIAKGMFLLIKNNPYLVVEREFVNPGKGAAFARVKMKNLKDGSRLKETFKTSETVMEADVYERPVQYLYKDDEYHFMDEETFEQFSVMREVLAEKSLYMHENEVYRLIFWEDTVIDIILPTKKIFTVVEAAEALKGDTATSVTKNIICDTGLVVKVPGFIKEAERIVVNTETGEYVERSNT